jgi:integrase
MPGRPHLHVVRRPDNPNRAVAKSRRQRAVPLDFLTVQAFDSYEFERMGLDEAAGSDFVFVNLFRGPLGAPMRLDAVNDLVAAAAVRAGIDPPPRPHQMRHAFASNVLDAGGALDEVQDLLGTHPFRPRRSTLIPIRPGCGPRWTRFPARATRAGRPGDGAAGRDLGGRRDIFSGGGRRQGGRAG